VGGGRFQRAHKCNSLEDFLGRRLKVKLDVVEK